MVLNEGLKEFLQMLTPDYRLFVARLDLEIKKIEDEKKEEFHYKGKLQA